MLSDGVVGNPTQQVVGTVYFGEPSFPSLSVNMACFPKFVQSEKWVTPQHSYYCKFIRIIASLQFIARFNFADFTW